MEAGVGLGQPAVLLDPALEALHPELAHRGHLLQLLEEVADGNVDGVAGQLGGQRAEEERLGADAHLLQLVQVAVGQTRVVVAHVLGEDLPLAVGAGDGGDGDEHRVVPSCQVAVGDVRAGGGQDHLAVRGENGRQPAELLHLGETVTNLQRTTFLVKDFISGIF